MDYKSHNDTTAHVILVSIDISFCISTAKKKQKVFFIFEEKRKQEEKQTNQTNKMPKGTELLKSCCHFSVLLLFFWNCIQIRERERVRYCLE